MKNTDIDDERDYLKETKEILQSKKSDVKDDSKKYDYKSKIKTYSEDSDNDDKYKEL